MRLVVFRDASSRAVEYICGVAERAVFAAEYAARNDVDAKLLDEFAAERIGSCAVVVRKRGINLSRRKARVPELRKEDDIRLALSSFSDECLRTREILFGLTRANVHLYARNLHALPSLTRLRCAKTRIFALL